MGEILTKKKVKAEIDKDGKLTFLTDEDGVSERDYLILITSIVFFGGIAIGLFTTLLGMFMGFELPDKYIQLVEAMDTVIITIVGGLFTVKATQTLVNRKPNNNSDNENSSEANNQSEGSDI